MRTGFGLGMAALALAFAPALARAQDTAEAPAPAPAESPAPQDVIGPSQLRDFTINGTVTRRAEPQAAAAPPRREAQPASTAAERSPVRTAAEPSGRTPTAEAGSSRPEPTASAALELPAFPGSSNAGELAPPSPAAAPSFAPSAEPATLPTTGGAALSEGGSVWPWLLAAIAAVLAAGLYFWRNRSRPAYAGAAFDLSPPETAPSRAPPQRSPPKAATPPRPGPRTEPPAAPPLSPAGIVSSRLRPWLELELVPTRCVYGQDGATIEFDLGLLNSGAVPARDVLVEAKLLNSGATQEEELAAFFARPRQQQEGHLAEIPQLKRIAFKASGALPLDQLRAYRVEERLLWVPIVAVNISYRWSGGEGQTSASYILGRETKGEKMAAFRLDRGARVFRGLGARLHTAGVRK